MQNAYAKLGRLPVAVSVALLAEGAQHLQALLPPTGGDTGLPASLSGLATVVLDGKKLKKLAKRLKVLRGLPGKLLAGKLLVALSLDSGLAIAMSADCEGERNDVPLVPQLLPQVRERITQPILWIADRQFANLELPAAFCGQQDHFLLRCGPSPHFHPDPQRPAQEGVDGNGRRYRQQWGWIGSATDKRRRYVRHITLFRPEIKDGEVALITDLLEEQGYPAVDLLECYLRRWGIERMFQQVTEVFQLQRLIGSTPQAAIFQGAFCFLLYNMIQVIRAYVAPNGQRPPEQVSSEKLLGDVTHELISWAKLGEAAQTAGGLGGFASDGHLRAWLTGRLRGVWSDRWIKAKPKKQASRPPAKVPKGHGGHTSAWKVILQSKHPPHPAPPPGPRP